MYEKTACILVVEDEPQLNKMICDYLETAGFKPLSAESGKSALRHFQNERCIDLILLDLMIPDIDGIDVARQIRKSSDLPIIMLTARSLEADKILGLEVGADDYITKPFSFKELSARLRAHLRRYRGTFSEGENEGQESLSWDRLRLDTVRRQLFVGETILDLTVTQYALMKIFLEQPERVFSRMDLLMGFQDDPYEGYERTIDAHIKNLRKLLRTAGADSYIKTVWGQGYKLGKGDHV